MKQPTPFFLSYAHPDKPDIDPFLEVLNPLLQISPKYDFHLWRDTAILPGEKWREEIDTALNNSRFGILWESSSPPAELLTFYPGTDTFW
ncbi:MAG: hypothetical protein ACKV2U_13100 [Bryobacteraceae bacterium]